MTQVSMPNRKEKMLGGGIIEIRKRTSLTAIDKRFILIK